MGSKPKGEKSDFYYLVSAATPRLAMRVGPVHLESCGGSVCTGENNIMKFLVTWQMHDEKMHDTLALFTEMTPEQEAGLMGNDMTLIGRWHDVIRGTGAAVYEAASAEAISAYSLNWNRFMDLDISIVLDDDETRALGRGMATGG
jgi:hypothetical protein